MNSAYIAIIVCGAVLVLCGCYKVFGIDKVKAWLLWAVTIAEQDFGSGTGKLKLAKVYDMFIAKFPKLQAIIPYKLFCRLVDKALVLMREMLKNGKISALVTKEGEWDG